MLDLGAKTQWGTVAAITNRGGERYYMMTDKDGSVALMPASTVDAAHPKDGA